MVGEVDDVQVGVGVNLQSDADETSTKRKTKVWLGKWMICRWV